MEVGSGRANGRYQHKQLEQRLEMEKSTAQRAIALELSDEM